MPVIKSAIKRSRQATKRTERNRKTLSHMRSLMKNIMQWSKDGQKEKAEKTFAAAQKAIDLAAKKNLIHKNNAARKKSSLARLMKGASMSTATGAKAAKAARGASASAPKAAAPKKSK